MNCDSARTFSTGTILGETDIIYKRDRCECFIAVTSVYALKFDSETLFQIMSEFPLIRKELEHLAFERERTRLASYQETGLLNSEAIKNSILQVME